MLRGRCLAASLNDAPHFVGWLKTNWPPLAGCQPADAPRLVRQLLVDAATASLDPPNLLPVVKIMIGASVADPARTTRQRILGLMAEAMPRHRSGAPGLAYSPRRMEQLEREVICPAVETALRLFLGKTSLPGTQPWLDYDLTITLRGHHANRELIA